MLKKLTKVLMVLAMGIVAVCLVMLSTGRALAGIEFGEAWITGVHHATSGNPALPGETPQPTFEVTKNADDASFGTLVAGTVNINGGYYAEMNKGVIVGFDIGIRIISGTNVKDLANPGLAFRSTPTGAGGRFSFNISASDLPATTQQNIINSCNSSNMNNGQSTFDFPVFMQIKAARYHTGNTALNARADKLVGGYVRSKVFCTTLTHSAGSPEPYSVDLRVTQQGETCPKKVEVRAFIKYRRPATAKFRFKVDGDLSELHEIRARKLRPQQGVPGDTYLVERVKFYHLDPGQHHFRIEVRGGQKSDVKTVNISCPPFAASDMWMSVKQQNKSTCPKNVNLKVLVNANRPGSVLTRIKNQAGVVMAIESVKVKRKGDHYEGVWKKTFNMREIDTQLIAEDMNDTGLNSGWQLLKVTCLETLKGTLTLQDPEGSKCPRKGRIAMAIQTSIPDKVGYRLKCNRGWHWSGKLDAQQTAPGTYLAVGVKSFKIKKNVHINCALQTVANGQWKTVALQGRKFQCITPTFDPGSNDLTVEPTPPAGASDTTPGGRIVDPVRPPSPPPGSGPGRIVDPVRTVSCAGGIVRNRSCYCPRTHKKVKTGPNAWRCVRSVVSDPVRTNPTGGTPGASADTGPVGGAPGTGTSGAGKPGAAPDTNTAGGKPTRTNPATANTSLAKPDVEKRRLEELKKRQQAQKKAAAAAKKKAAAAAKKKVAAAAKKKAAAVKKKVAAAAKKKAAAAKKKAAAVAKRKAAAAAAKRKAAAATAARRQSAATAAKRSNKKRKKKGKKKGKRTIAQ